MIGSNEAASRSFLRRACLFGPLLAAAWAVLYVRAEPFSKRLAFDWLGLQAGSRAGEAVQFFAYDAVKILLLLTLMVYVMAWLRAGLNAERVRAWLGGRARWIGYSAAAVFGAVTPFCSCSSVPLFIGFTAGGIPLGFTMAFLITSPIINEVAVVLLWGLLGWKITLLYVAVGLSAGIVGGALMDAARADRWLQPFLLQARGRAASSEAPNPQHLTPADRHAFAWSETRSIFRRVWVWVIVGVGLGALLHGFVPQDWIVEHLSADNVWAVPGAVLLGIPLYTNVTGVVPVMESLLLKGLPLGTTLAFSMSTVAASLPEVMMLKQVMRPKLLAFFLSLLALIFVLIGWLINWALGV